MNSFVSGTLSTLFSIYVYRLFIMFREKLMKKDLVEIVEIVGKVMKRQNFGTRRSIVATKKFDYYKQEEEERGGRLGGLLSHRELMLLNLVQFLISILTLISMLGNILEIIQI